MVWAALGGGGREKRAQVVGVLPCDAEGEVELACFEGGDEETCPVRQGRHQPRCIV